MSMRLRGEILYTSFGAGLVVLGMVLNLLIGGDADAQMGVQDTAFRRITYEELIITDGDKRRKAFGLSANGDAMLEIYGDDGQDSIVYLGPNQKNGEMMCLLESRSKNDQREISTFINENGGRFGCMSKMREAVVHLGVHADGGLDVRDKHGYKR